MFCYKCGHEAKEGERFCVKCGTALHKEENTKQPIKLFCEDCGGIMEVDPERPILSCPYCNSKKLIPESDDVTLERIRSSTYKKVELEKLNLERDKMELEEKKRQEEIKKEKDELKWSYKFLFGSVILWLVVAYLILNFS